MAQRLQRNKTDLIVFLSDLWFCKAQQAGWLCVSRGKAVTSSLGEGMTQATTSTPCGGLGSTWC